MRRETLKWLVCALIMLSAVSAAVAQSFTYQGFLKDGGNPANGNYDFQCLLYDGPGAGATQIGSTVSTTRPVQNGLFTVDLNFGAYATIWTGADRYLEIRVRRAGGGSYTTLSPRVKINPTPYSFYAFRAPWSGLVGIPAGFADGIDNDTTYSAGAGLSLVGTTFSVATGGIVTNMLADLAVTTAKIADGAVTTAKLANGAVTDAKLSNTGVAAGNYGSATQVAQFTVNAQGRITSATNVTISGVSPGGPAGGDLSGTYPNPTVARLQTRPVAPTAPSVGQVLKWNGSAWAPANDLTDQLWQQAGANIYYTAGNVGIGTTSPGYLLDVRGDRNDRLLNVVNSNTGITADGIWADTAGSGGYAVHGIARGASGSGVFGYASATTGTNYGVVGRSDSTSGYGGYFIGRGYFRYNSTPANATLRLHETEADFARLEFTNTNIARKWHIAGFIGSTVADDRLNFWNSSAGDIMSIRGDGTVAVKVLEITGADLAEKFPTTEKIEPGMVVEIDPDNPGHLRLSRSAYNKRVAGIVAGANGLSTGVILGNLEGSEQQLPIAMSGRVWVYADATERAIEPGDLLTTAERPGYAMAVDPNRPAHGAILGKAMTGLKKGKTGMVLVLVNLH